MLSVGFFFLLLTMAVNIVMAQAWVPGHPSTASSLLMGFAWGIGGVTLPIVGKIADIYGLERALLAVAWMPLIGILLARRLAEPPAQERAAAV